MYILRKGLKKWVNNITCPKCSEDEAKKIDTLITIGRRIIIVAKQNESLFWWSELMAEV